MEKSSTKERILEQALLLFSQKGYDAVSVEQIAAAVGIKAPSLYKHYKSKRDIFDGIFAEMQRRYEAQTAQMQMHLDNGAQDVPLFADMVTEELIAMVQQLVTYSLHDPFVSRFRRLMTIEQFRSPELSALYTQRYVQRMLHYHEILFQRLIAQRVLRAGDVHAMAWQYVSPVLVLLGICDRHPDKEQEAMAELESHIRQFQAVYQWEALEKSRMESRKNGGLEG